MTPQLNGDFISRSQKKEIGIGCANNPSIRRDVVDILKEFSL
jgi:hypothetical protein